MIPRWKINVFFYVLIVAFAGYPQIHGWWHLAVVMPVYFFYLGWFGPYVKRTIEVPSFPRK